MSREAREARRRELEAQAARSATEEALRTRARREFLAERIDAGQLDARLSSIDAGAVELPAGQWCGCDCGEKVASPSTRSRYVDDRHKQRAYRVRVNVEGKRAGVPSRLTLESVQTARTSHERLSHAPDGLHSDERAPSAFMAEARALLGDLTAVVGRLQATTQRLEARVEQEHPHPPELAYVGGPCPDASMCRYRFRHASGPWTCEQNHPRERAA